METQSHDIRGVLIAVTGGRVLLPNATVAEVITFSPPERIEGAPDWLLGRIRWRGWRLPVISYASMIGSAHEEGELGAKVVVLKAIGNHPHQSYFAILAQGFPRLVTVSRDTLRADPNYTPEPTSGVLMKVYVRGDVALIPDLPVIEARIAALELLHAA